MMFNDAFHLLGLIAVGLLIAWTVTRLSRRYNRLLVDRVIDTRHRDFDNLLSRNNPYYRSLTAEGRTRFLYRVLLFIEGKILNISISAGKSLCRCLSALRLYN